MAKKSYKNSLLYKVSATGLKKPSYLFGTMHMICARDFYIPAKVISALSKCSTYYMEVDLGSEDETQTMELASSENRDWTGDLTENEKKSLREIVVQRLGITGERIDEIPPMALINQMTLNAMDCEEIKVAEIELLKVAREKGLESAGIETAMQQMKIARKVFNGKELLKQLKTDGVNYKDLFEKIILAYQHEKLEELAALVTDKKFMSRRAFNILVTNRNKRWAKEIPSLISSHSCFIAVGAGHLPGETGIIKALSDQGFKVNPVYR